MQPQSHSVHVAPSSKPRHSLECPVIHQGVELGLQGPRKDRVRDDGPCFDVSLVCSLGEVGRGDQGPVLVDDDAFGVEASTLVTLGYLSCAQTGV